MAKHFQYRVISKGGITGDQIHCTIWIEGDSQGEVTFASFVDLAGVGDREMSAMFLRMAAGAEVILEETGNVIDEN